MEDRHDQMINSRAVPVYNEETVQAQSAEHRRRLRRDRHVGGLHPVAPVRHRRRPPLRRERPDDAHGDTCPGSARLGGARDGDAGQHPPARCSALGEAAERAVAEAFAVFREMDRVFSTYRDDSDLMRLRREEVELADASPLVQRGARDRRAGRARHASAPSRRCCPPGRATSPSTRPASSRGGRSTGPPRACSTCPARRRASTPAATCSSCRRATFPVEGAGSIAWRVGVEDPRDRSQIASSVSLTEGAVATSGTAARGAHLYDPRTGGDGRSQRLGDRRRPDAALGRHLGDGALRRRRPHGGRLRPVGARLPLHGALSHPAYCALDLIKRVGKQWLGARLRRPR